MSFESEDGLESLKNKNIKALESLNDERLSKEAILLRDALLALGEERTVAVIGDGQLKIDLLFFKAAPYGVGPKSLLFLEEAIDNAAVAEIRIKLRDFRQYRGKSKEMMIQEQEAAGEIAALLAQLVQAEYKDAA